jgi:hypothetical protein
MVDIEFLERIMHRDAAALTGTETSVRGPTTLRHVESSNGHSTSKSMRAMPHERPRPSAEQVRSGAVARSVLCPL